MANDSHGIVGFFDVLMPSTSGATGEDCANSSTMADHPLTVGDTDFYVQHYVFPVQFILGVAGNCINLLVLLSSGMKNPANILLSAMAFADLAFLICLLPFSLASFQFFYSSYVFAYLFHRYKTHAVAFANMFSMAASYFVLAVSLERFSGVRKPMQARFEVREHRLCIIIVSVYLLSFVTTFWHHADYNVTIYLRCNTLRPIYQLVSMMRSTSKVFVTYIYYAKIFQTLVGIAFPVIAVSILNVSLIYYLRKREIMPRTVTDKQPEFRFVRYSDIGTFQRQERKVTATVLAIITCFSVTHLPTLLPFVLEYFAADERTKRYNVITLLNTLLVSGKVLNFVLFCLSSAHFRQRTMVIISARLCRNGGRKKYSSMATQSTNAKISNAGSYHHSVVLHHTDSLDTPLQHFRTPSGSCSTTTNTPRGPQRVQLQLQRLMRDDSLEAGGSSTGTVTSARSVSESNNNDSKPFFGSPAARLQIRKQTN